MGQPAARLGDMHVCPMVTPGLPPIPHVGGPIITPGAPNVLIGGQPAATIGCMCTCVGPPDVIIRGSLGVLIGGRPAARMGDNTAHGGTIVMGFPMVLIGDIGMGSVGGGAGGMAGGIGGMVLASPIGNLILKVVNWVMDIIVHSPLSNPKVKELMVKSPTLTNNITQLTKDGWVIKFGEAGKGSFCDKERKEIVIDPNETDGTQITQTLAHETGHALYTTDPYVPPQGLTREQYAAANANSDLKDEGEATLMNAQIRDEILDNGGEDIGIAGTQQSQYESIYEDYQKDGDRESARQRIGDAFADGENPSTDPSKTYRQYYEQTYLDYYDNMP